MTRAIVAMCLVASLPTLSRAADFYSISSITSSTAADDLYPASNLILGPGVGIDAAEPHDKILGGAEGNWVTAAPGGFPSDYIAVAGMPILELDLGMDVALNEISTWGYASTNSNGASEYSLRFATEADGPAGYGTSIAANPTFSMTIDDMVRQSESFELVTARYVEFTVSDTHFVAPGDGSGGEIPGGDRAGLGEIAFQVVPEPSSGLLLLLGMIPVLRRRRR